MIRNDALIANIRAQLTSSEAFRGLLARLERDRIDVTGASVEARALVLAALHETVGRRLAIVIPGDASIADFQNALQLFIDDPRCVTSYPSPALSPYQDVGPSLGVTREEIRALGLLIDRAADVLIIPVRALFARLPRADEFRSRLIALAQGQDLDVRQLLQTLVENGFVRTDLVGESGEFAFRGGILDLFPPNTTHPVRVELFGDTVESLRWFDVETQRSEEPSGAVTVFPMTQFPITTATRSALARRLSLDFQDPLYKHDLSEKIDRLNEQGTFPGIEHYLPLAADAAPFADYLAE
ncbi:MAG: hypothetical protein ABI837_03275, partial [Acidobacteriota bacterium]